MDRIMKTKLSVALLALALPVVIASAQSQGVTPEATERFEVATVRQNTNSVRSGPGFSGQPGRFSAQDVTLQDLITFAYELQAFEIFGAPNWATSDRFDIGATMQPPPTGSAPGPRNRRLLRALLAERFALVAHEERREMAVYTLVMARPDRKLGAQLRPFEGVCAEKIAAPPSMPPQLPAQLPPPSKDPSPCILGVGVGRLSARGTSLSDLSRSPPRLPLFVVGSSTGRISLVSSISTWSGHRLPHLLACRGHSQTIGPTVLPTFSPLFRSNLASNWNRRKRSFSFLSSIA